MRRGYNPKEPTIRRNVSEVHSLMPDSWVALTRTSQKEGIYM